MISSNVVCISKLWTFCKSDIPPAETYHCAHYRRRPFRKLCCFAYEARRASSRPPRNGEAPKVHF